MTNPPTAQTLQEKFEATFADIDTWRLRTRGAWRSQSGSELAEDDLAWPWPVTQMIVGLLASARDHLDAVRLHIVDGEPYPFADATLLRTGLSAAAQAVWILTPDERTERLRRSRVLLLEEYTQHLKFLNDTVRLSIENDGVEHADTVKARDWVAGRKQEVIDLRESLGETETFEATRIIQQASTAVFDAGIGLELVVDWRRGSAAAHGLAWSVLGLPSTKTVAGPDDQGSFSRKRLEVSTRSATSTWAFTSCCGAAGNC